MGARGEQIIEIPDGGEIRILFTNQALATAEGRMERSAMGVARALVEGEAGISDVAQLLRAGMEAANREAGGNGARRAISLSEAYRVLDQAGLLAVITAVTEAMTAVLMYRPEASEGGERDSGN